MIAFVVCVLTSLSVFYGRQYSYQLFQGQTLEASSTLAKGTRLCTITIPISIFSGLFTKLSICLFLLRIFQTVRKWKLGLYAIMAFTAASILPSIVLFVAQCQPIQKQWDPLLPGKCWSPDVVIRMSYFAGGKSPCNSLPHPSQELRFCQRCQCSATGHLQLFQSSSCGICR